MKQLGAAGVVIAIVTVLSASGGNVLGSSAPLQSEIEALILQFGSAMANKNTTVLENIVASEITLGNDLAPDEAPTISRSQFIADLTGMETLLITRWDDSNIEIVSSTDTQVIATSIHVHEFTAPDTPGTLRESGNMEYTFIREGGGWRLSKTILNNYRKEVAG